ncbi:hypothetical protein CPB84DRAFT_1759464 [Gymnopilus junonius]|uniref:Uncharacterized protein n=1 Tax=Gymnopilus junonius TaxID=109634 RepID=A0A9P5P1W5_GYMJU|nr:hypothetical protein CPB84DRAFT_1759464 [Gymnopilus junonius]
MSTSSRQRPPSATSLNHSTSLRSFRRPPPPATIVVTSPPWARDEPPSPTEHLAPSTDGPHLTETRISDVTSFHSRHPSDGTSRWWSFTRTRPRQDTFNLIPPSPKTERKSFRDISLSWMPTSATPREPGFLRKEKERESDPSPTPHLSIPIPSQPPHTLAHNNTPGWDTPWTSRPAAQGPTRQSRDDDEESYGFREDNQSDSSHKNLSGWALRRRKLRSFILVNTYVPLLFRFINIAFTTAALGISIRIRNLELDHNALGAVGSSPTVVIIFAPLTLIHVMVAIYLEYFGRPLGLWRTSAKLAHTLSEVLFICAWSAALSLCFDNFFTSLIPCASASSSSWYNKLPRPNYNIPNFEGSVGDDICDQQLALICLVGVGLIAYCSNLVISLYRVFEKVKYHSHHPTISMRRP